MEVRIKVQRPCPNLLFKKWIEEMHNYAVKKQSRSQYSLKLALHSIKQYPLEIKSGSECIILKGFNKSLCKVLDRKLESHHKDLNNYCNPSTIDQSNNNLNNNKRLSVICSNKITPATKKHKSYVPGYRTGAYAILMALLKNYEIDKKIVAKNDLQIQAQEFCNESMMKPKPGSFYTAWSSIKSLCTRGYVTQQRKRITYYSLSDSGYDLAKKISHQNSAMEMDNKDNEPFSFVTTSNVDCTIPLNDNNIPCEIKEISTSPLANLNSNQIFLPNTFDVLLLVDKQETSGKSKKDDATILELNKYKMIKYELRHLKVGDFMWIARDMANGKELVLPHIVERKRMDDLAGSIKDGRFHEQKFRLKQCGLPNVMYLFESHGKDQHLGLPLSTLTQAIANTRIQEGFMTHCTASLSGSIKFLAMMTKIIREYYTNKTLHLTTGQNSTVDASFTDCLYLSEFQNFNAMASKTKVLTVKDLFIKQLLQFKGISVEMAVVIASEYETPYNLMNSFKTCATPELMLTTIKYGFYNKKIGTNLSKIVYQYFTNAVLS